MHSECFESCYASGNKPYEQHGEQQRCDGEREGVGAESRSLAEQHDGLRQVSGASGKIVATLLHGDDEQHQCDVTAQGDGIDGHGYEGGCRTSYPLANPVFHHDGLWPIS